METALSAGFCNKGRTPGRQNTKASNGRPASRETRRLHLPSASGAAHPGQEQPAPGPLAHVRDTAGEINTNTGPRPDHAASIARIRRFSATTSTSPLKRRLRPQRRCNSIIAGKTACHQKPEPFLLSATGGMSSGRNTVVDGGDSRPFFRNSRRQV